MSLQFNAALLWRSAKNPAYIGGKIFAVENQIEKKHLVPKASRVLAEPTFVFWTVSSLYAELLFSWVQSSHLTPGKKAIKRISQKHVKLFRVMTILIWLFYVSASPKSVKQEKERSLFPSATLLNLQLCFQHGRETPKMSAEQLWTRWTFRSVTESRPHPAGIWGLSIDMQFGWNNNFYNLINHSGYLKKKHLLFPASVMWAAWIEYLWVLNH